MSQRPGTDMSSAFTTTSYLSWVEAQASPLTGLRSCQHLTLPRSVGLTLERSRTLQQQLTTVTTGFLRQGGATVLYRRATMLLWWAATTVTMSLATLGGLTSSHCSGGG